MTISAAIETVRASLYDSREGVTSNEPFSVEEATFFALVLRDLAPESTVSDLSAALDGRVSAADAATAFARASA